MNKRPDKNLETNNRTEFDFFNNISINNRKRISDELFYQLREAIISGELPEGYLFPNENTLCKQLDIGRSSLREAYAPLETMNLIKRTKNGTFVNNAAKTKNSMNFNVIAQYTNPINVIEYRQIFEVGIARLAAQKAQPEDIEILSDIVDQMEENSADSDALTELDFQFHSHLVSITGNELLVISFNSIRSNYEKFVNEQFKKRMFDQSLIDHRALIQALKDNNSDKAEQLMREHLSHIEEVAKR